MRPIPHDDRPHEKRAEEYVRLAEAKSYSGEVQGFDDAILNLAIGLTSRILDLCLQWRVQ